MAAINDRMDQGKLRAYRRKPLPERLAICHTLIDDARHKRQTNLQVRDANVLSTKANGNASHAPVPPFAD